MFRSTGRHSDSILHAQEQPIHLSRHSKNPAWLNSEILKELRCKNKEHESDGKKEQASKAEYRNITQACRDAEGKVKAQP